LLEVSRVCKIPANERILAMMLFPSFQDIGLGCCTVAAQLPHFFSQVIAHLARPARDGVTAA
jgi:hypothetical protein